MWLHKYVVGQICKQFPAEVVTAALFTQRDFLHLMDEKLRNFREEMAANRGRWKGTFQRRPCQYIGMQVCRKTKLIYAPKVHSQQKIKPSISPPAAPFTN